ncbi:MAG: SDR family NAD(P)-dependent oxidoreductase [Chitinophagales bacterium]
MHYEASRLEAIDSKQLQQTFSTNVFAMFWITREVLKRMPADSAIINTASVTAFRGSPFGSSTCLFISGISRFILYDRSVFTS